MTAQPFPTTYFQRYDESSDFNFYSMPRKVVHIDEWAISQLRHFYEDVLSEGDTILDLMSSWRSHLPEDRTFAHVDALGMNGEEMEDNPQLDQYVVQSLNDKPQLPYDDERFDAVLCAVSVQYLTNPVAVFAEVNRVLKPGGIFVVSFSNRCFPTKAVAVWLNSTDNQHVALVTQYFEEAGNYSNIEAQIKTTGPQDPLFIVNARRAE